MLHDIFNSVASLVGGGSSTLKSENVEVDHNNGTLHCLGTLSSATSCDFQCHALKTKKMLMLSNDSVGVDNRSAMYSMRN